MDKSADQSLRTQDAVVILADSRCRGLMGKTKPEQISSDLDSEGSYALEGALMALRCRDAARRGQDILTDTDKQDFSEKGRKTSRSTRLTKSRARDLASR